MSVNGSAKENGRGSANLHPVTVKTFAEVAGMSERQAKYWRKGWANPVHAGDAGRRACETVPGGAAGRRMGPGLACLDLHSRDGSRMGAQGRRAYPAPGMQRGTATASRH